MQVNDSIFKLSLVFFGLNCACAFSQKDSVKTFIEVHSGIMCYNTYNENRIVNPVSGIVLNASLSSRTSVELYYSNAWINEDVIVNNHFGSTVINHKERLDWVGFRVGLGERTDSYSVRFLFGASAGRHIGLEMGCRYTKTFLRNFSVNASAIGKVYAIWVFDYAGMYQDETVATPMIGNIQLGIGYHF